MSEKPQRLSEERLSEIRFHVNAGISMKARGVTFEALRDLLKEYLAISAEMKALRKHIEPMIAEAFRAGNEAEGTSDLEPLFTGRDSWPTPQEYAARIIKALTDV